MMSKRFLHYVVPNRFLSTNSGWIYPNIKQIESYENYLTIKWQNGQEGKFLYPWLRENCPEPHTMRLTDISKSRKFQLKDLDLDIKPTTIENHVSSLFIKWPGDVCGNYSSGWLLQRNSGDDKVKSDREYLHELEKPQLWNGVDIKNIVKQFEFESLFNNQQTLLELLTLLLKYGLVFIKNAPQKGQLELLTNLIGYHYITPYGHFFAVRGDPKPTNQAYTSDALAFHTDEPYLQYAPQVQALHCIRQASTGSGGESRYVDGYFVAEQIRQHQPEIFELLSTVPVEYADEGKDYTEFFSVYKVPVISLDKRGTVKKVIVNNGMRSWFTDVPLEKQLDFYKALKYFDEECNKPENYFQVLLNPGDIVIFDNLRILHGRNEFQRTSIEGCERLLEGVYFNYDVVKSKIRNLRKKFNPEETISYISF